MSKGEVGLAAFVSGYLSGYIAGCLECGAENPPTDIETVIAIAEAQFRDMVANIAIASVNAAVDTKVIPKQ